MKLKEMWKKFWFLLWKDDSFKGWIFSIIFLFVFIKFIFFPFISFLTGTSLPLAIVESCSMYHQGNLLSNNEIWFEEHNGKYTQFEINKEEFQNFRFKKGLNKGDILLITRANPDKLKVGDVIIFNGGASNPIIHRIIEIKEIDGKKYFSTIGDNNNGQLPFEKEISEDRLVGKATIKMIPYAGWAKLIFFEGKKSQDQRGFCKEN